MYCNNCGTKLPDGVSFCPECGTPVENATAPKPQQAQPQYAPPQQAQPQYAQPQQAQPQYAQPAAPQYAQPQQQAQPQYAQPQQIRYAQPQQQAQPQQIRYAQPAQPAAPQYAQPAAPQYAQPQQPVYNVNNVTNNYNQYSTQPARRLATNRALWKFILLGIVTFGIYEIVYFTNVSTSLNTAASRYDGRKTMNFCLVFFIFSWLTLGILPLVWFTKMSGRVGTELQRRGINYSFGAGAFWLWFVLGSLFIAGPFIYIHKLSVSMNRICEDYNARG